MRAAAAPAAHRSSSGLLYFEVRRGTQVAQGRGLQNLHSWVRIPPAPPHSTCTVVLRSQPVNLLAWMLMPCRCSSFSSCTSLPLNKSRNLLRVEWAPIYHVKGWGKFNRHYKDFFSPPLTIRGFWVCPYRVRRVRLSVNRAIAVPRKYAKFGISTGAFQR